MLDWSLITEFLAVALGLIYVALIARENVWGWPAGLVGALISTVVLSGVRLYLDAALYGFYAAVTAYGWYCWTAASRRPKETSSSSRGAPRIHRAAPRDLIVILGVASLATLATGWLASSWTDTDVPYWDAWTSCFSVAGTFMQARKLFENWILWMVVNAVYVGLYFYKGLVLFSAVSALYLLLAIYGHVRWRRSLD